MEWASADAAMPLRSCQEAFQEKLELARCDYQANDVHQYLDIDFADLASLN